MDVAYTDVPGFGSVPLQQVLHHKVCTVGRLTGVVQVRRRRWVESVANAHVQLKILVHSACFGRFITRRTILPSIFFQHLLPFLRRVDISTDAHGSRPYACHRSRRGLWMKQRASRGKGQVCVSDKQGLVLRTIYGAGRGRLDL